MVYSQNSQLSKYSSSSDVFLPVAVIIAKTPHYQHDHGVSVSIEKQNFYAAEIRAKRISTVEKLVPIFSLIIFRVACDVLRLQSC